MRHLLPIIIALFWIVSPNPAYAADFNALIQTFNQHADFPLPTLKPNQINELKNGQVVSMIERHKKRGGRAIGMKVVHTDMTTLWTAYRDTHFQQQSKTTEFMLSEPQPDVQFWYGYIDTPWPIADRHWIIKTWNNLKLAQKTNNRCWEHPWKLVEDGEKKVSNELAKHKLPAHLKPKSAVYTPVNEGAWVVLHISPQKTLLIYHATTVIGGNIPDNIIPPLVMSTFKEMLTGMQHRAEKLIKKHYVAPHTHIILGGDGKPVPHF